MTRERRHGLLVMGPLALVSVYMLISGIAALVVFVTQIAMRAHTVIAYSGDVAVVPGAFAILSLAIVEIVRPSERWRSRLFGLSLGAFAGMIVLPIAFMLASGPALSTHGYVRCSEHVVGSTLPAARYALDSGYCHASV